VPRAAECAIAAIIILCSPVAAASADLHQENSLARMLLQGCLAAPSEKGVRSLAAKVAATAFSRARIERELGRHDTHVEVDDRTRPDEAQRTESSVMGFMGWDLPGDGAGSLEYVEGTMREARVEVHSGQVLTPWRSSKTHECRISAPVANAAALFQLYEQLQHAPYGILVSADRKAVTVFTFDPDWYDVELHFGLKDALAGLPADVNDVGVSRLIMPGGPSFENDAAPGVPTVKLSRAALLAGLDHPADMAFDNMAMEPIVQRLSLR